VHYSIASELQDCRYSRIHATS